MLVAVYLLQRFSYAEMFNMMLPEALHIRNASTIFVVNKTVRLVINDLACMLLIYALFEKKHLTIAFYLFLVELLVMLPVYFIIKLSVEGVSEISSPLLSQVHRLIVNPLLMFLLMMGFVIQRLQQRKV